ncbi:hypothetical protein CYY_006094 [Polysphondylium violaceum]|uniref:DUF6748 domain-containing protein n=1 Tax=Polysphondylium violaceum TaxID=133409 RepID=A0A8J4PSA1_9MYCE|nr:hypothetical protein CYY_006094 [Polysphondylium violaceum]
MKFSLLLLTTLLLVSGVFSLGEDRIGAFYYYLQYEPKQCYTIPCAQYRATKANSNESFNILGISFISGINANDFLKQSENVVIYGTLGGTQYKDHFNLASIAAFKPLPQTTSLSKTLAPLYSFKSSGIVCIKAPCPSMSAVLVNSGQTTNIVGETEPYSSTVTLFDKDWFFGRFYQEGNPKLLAQGSIVNSTFAISNAFISLPDPASPCPKVSKPLCNKPGTVGIFTRDQNRCVSSAGCVEGGACILSIPVCPSGYRLSSYPGGKFGCPVYNCDAKFLKETVVPK